MTKAGVRCNLDQSYQPGHVDFGFGTGWNMPACIGSAVKPMGIKGYPSAYILISNIQTQFGASGTNLLAEVVGHQEDAPAIPVEPLLAEAMNRFAKAGVFCLR